MVKSLFIIDFKESVVFDSGAQEYERDEFMNKVKALCRKNCQTHDKLFKQVLPGNSLQIFAKSNEDSFIVGAIVQGKTSKESEVIEVLDGVHKLVASHDYEAGGISSIQTKINQILRKHNSNNITEDINQEIDMGRKRVATMIEKSLKDAERTNKILVEAQLIESDSKELNAKSSELKSATFWELNKLNLFIYGFAGLLVLLIAIVILKALFG